jgi:hypothetical protein
MRCWKDGAREIMLVWRAGRGTMCSEEDSLPNTAAAEPQPITSLDFDRNLVAEEEDSGDALVVLEAMGVGDESSGEGTSKLGTVRDGRVEGDGKRRG